MKRYAASFRALVEGEAVDGWNEAAVVLASDVADLERRYREAVDLLRSERDIITDDDFDRWQNERNAFLAEEDV